MTTKTDCPHTDVRRDPLTSDRTCRGCGEPMARPGDDGYSDPRVQTIADLRFAATAIRSGHPAFGIGVNEVIANWLDDQAVGAERRWSDPDRFAVELAEMINDDPED